MSLVLFILPIIGYEVCTLGFGIDGIEAGRWIGVGFTLFTTVLWVGTYIFRVATKDMTYVSKYMVIAMYTHMPIIVALYIFICLFAY